MGVQRHVQNSTVQRRWRKCHPTFATFDSKNAARATAPHKCSVDIQMRELVWLRAECWERSVRTILLPAGKINFDVLAQNVAPWASKKQAGLLRVCSEVSLIRRFGVSMGIETVADLCRVISHQSSVSRCPYHSIYIWKFFEKNEKCLYLMSYRSQIPDPRSRNIPAWKGSWTRDDPGYSPNFQYRLFSWLLQIYDF